MMVALMLRTGISVSTWEAEGTDVILTAIDLLSRQGQSGVDLLEDKE